MLRTLNGAEDRLSRCEDTVCHDETNAHDGKDLENGVRHFASLQPASDAAIAAMQLGTKVSFHGHRGHVSSSGICLDDVALNRQYLSRLKTWDTLTYLESKV